MEQTGKLDTRAILCPVVPQAGTTCEGCNEAIKFSARAKALKVICNVYVRRKWNRVEQWHHDCYIAADYPHGEPIVRSDAQAFLKRLKKATTAVA